MSKSDKDIHVSFWIKNAKEKMKVRDFIDDEYFKDSPTVATRKLLRENINYRMHKDRKKDITISRWIINAFMDSADVNLLSKLASDTAQKHFDDWGYKKDSSSYEDVRQRVRLWWKKYNGLMFDDSGLDSPFYWKITHEMGINWSTFHYEFNKKILEIMGARILKKSKPFESKFEIYFKF